MLSVDCLLTNRDLYGVNVNVHVPVGSVTHSLIHTLTHSIIHSVLYLCLNHSALTTFRKETEEGEELELHGAEVSALMNLVATDTMVEEVSKRHTHTREQNVSCVSSLRFSFGFSCLLLACA